MKAKFNVTMESYGLYTPFEKGKPVPSIQKFSDIIPVKADIEFGYVLRIRKGHGKKITFRIDHPPFKNEQGNITPAFTGEAYIKGNDFRFFLGDTFWPPFADKRGRWTLTTWVDSQEVAKKTLTMV